MKDTTIILQQLRLLMLNMTLTGQQNLSAYIVPSSDAHHNIRRADCDQRLAYISGFDGSSGTAIITHSEALMWTDARYFIQADQQMDDNWTLMKEGLQDTPSQAEWLINKLQPGEHVGIDPTLYSKSEWNSMLSSLNSANITLSEIETNLVDTVWGSERPPRPVNPVRMLAIEFSGRSINEKLADIRSDMITENSETLVISELDEIAWILNLRGTDLPEAPTFFAFAILTQVGIDLFIEESKLSEEIKTSLITETNGTISFNSYESVLSHLKTHISETTGRVWLSSNCNYAMVSVVPETRQIIKITPIAIRKAVKNPTEINGMKKALIREAAALCVFYASLEKAMSEGQNVTEVSAATELLQIKQKQDNFVSLSFKTISGSGPNGAIIHYFPTEETDRSLAVNEMYLLDSGSHYLDGTTDTTRTFHFGQPTDFQKDCYTRVLKGQIALATSRFPQRTKGHAIDAIARRFLWEVGLDFGHGTGHGVGAYLNVGEGPQSINSVYNSNDPGLQENMITSNEPGYYEEGQFGIRLENLLRVVKSNLSDGFLEMEDLTFVPYQRKLIKLELLTPKEKMYLNEYQTKTREITGSFIVDHNMGDEAYSWLIKETMPFDI